MRTCRVYVEKAGLPPSARNAWAFFSKVREFDGLFYDGKAWVIVDAEGNRLGSAWAATVRTWFDQFGKGGGDQ